jgi:hypothetical protein
MIAHINYFTGHFYGLKCRFYHRSRRPNKRDHRTVGCMARINVQKFHACYRLNGIRDAFYNGHIPPF